MNLHSQTPPHIYSVGKLTQEIKYLLEEKYDIVWITGETSNLRVPSSGHAYFTLKDDRAQIAAVMFKGQLRQLKFDLVDGTSIVGMGRISVYEPRGTYQIILEYLEPKGIGALQIAFEQLKAKLAADGFFEPSHKKPIPFLPRKIGIITSAGGAAVQDILKIAERRFENIAIDIYPVHVQGDKAAIEIAHALELANKLNQVEVLIVARGGGSLEDLMAFNTETVAKAIFFSEIPVVSAVGHETDFTIADFVADLRAPTPSAAAELVVPLQAELLSRCKELKQRCLNAIEGLLRKMTKEVEQLRRRLVHPQKKIQDFQLHLDALHQRLVQGVENRYNWQVHSLSNHMKLMYNLNPQKAISQYHIKLDILRYKLIQTINRYIDNGHRKIAFYSSALNALSPLSVLKRGYSITRALPHGSVISDVEEVALDQSLEIILFRGALKARVTNRQKTNKIGI